MLMVMMIVKVTIMTIISERSKEIAIEVVQLETD